MDASWQYSASETALGTASLSFNSCGRIAAGASLVRSASGRPRRVVADALLQLGCKAAEHRLDSFELVLLLIQFHAIVFDNVLLSRLSGPCIEKDHNHVLLLLLMALVRYAFRIALLPLIQTLELPFL